MNHLKLNHLRPRMWLALVALYVGTVTSVHAQKRPEPILHGSSERLRFDAVYAPVPLYPSATLAKQRSGLVVVETTVLPKGVVGKLELISSFDNEASEAVTAALRQWRFTPVDKSPGVKDCNDCIRIARFLFEFSIANGKARVVDLAAAENERDPRVRSK